MTGGILMNILSKLMFPLFGVPLVFSSTVGGRSSSSAATAGGPGAPPKFLNVIHMALQPGKNSAHAEQEAAIVRGYRESKIPVYWLEWDSVTGPSGALYLNLFDSFEQAENAGAAMGAGLAANPKLAKMQEQLLLDNVTSLQTVFTLLREDLGYGTVNFAKARLLRVTTIEVRPGHEGEFVEAARSIRAASEKAHADVAWAVYEVNAGMATPAFLFITPMRSMKEIDAAVARRNLYEDAKGDVFQQRLREIARLAYATTESEIYSVGREQSHVSKEFAEEDPEFWKAPAEKSSKKEGSADLEALKKNP
jgi:hypothetical protein